MNQKISEVNLDFSMAKQKHADEFLRGIAREALGFLFRYINVSKIKCILITGSLANGEGTVIKYDSTVVASDFDFVIYLNFPYYLKSRNLFQQLSQQISTILVDRKINTHVVFLPTIEIFHRIIPSKNSAIYDYEFTTASKCIFGKTPSLNKFARPTKKDALELTFTVISDLVFSDLKNFSKIEKSYIYAKRALTLLNSILIFHGFFVETYQKRIEIARKCSVESKIPLTPDEIKILEAFTEYKLSGSLHRLLGTLSFNSITDLVHFQRRFLTHLAIKILHYELKNLLNAGEVKSNTNLFLNMIHEFPILLRKYLEYLKTGLFSRILGVILYFIWSFLKDKERMELFATFIFYKQSPKVVLNTLITLILVYGENISIGKILKKVFPWINLNNTPAIYKLFSLWQVAEQSLKL